MKKNLVVIVVAAIFILQVGLVIASEDPDDDKHHEDDVDYIEPDWNWWGLKYQNGHLTSNSMDFYINETTGTITDFTLITERYEYSCIERPLPKEESKGNEESHDEDSDEGHHEYIEEKYFESYEIKIKIFDKIEIDGFKPLKKPIVFENKFIFMSENLMIFIEDSWDTRIQFVPTNSTINMKYYLSEGITASKTPTKDMVFDDDGEKKERRIKYPFEYLWIEGENIQGNLMSDNASFEINGTEIKATLSSHSTFSAYYIEPYPVEPIFFEEYYWEDREYYDSEEIYIDEKGYIQKDSGDPLYNKLKDAIYQDKIAVETHIFLKDDKVQKRFNYYDTDFHTEIIKANKDLGFLEIKVSSDNPEGKVVMIDIDEQFISIKNESEIIVKFDGEQIESTYDIDSILKGDSIAKFHLILGEKGVGLLVYVPHFSEHTITVEKAKPQGQLSLKNGDSEINKLIPVAFAVGITVLGAVVLVRRGKKE